MTARPVILLTRAGTIDGPCHHPAPQTRNATGPYAFPDLKTSFPPSDWPTLCTGERGLVYVKDGCLARVSWCVECVAIAEGVAA